MLKGGTLRAVYFVRKNETPRRFACVLKLRNYRVMADWTGACIFFQVCFSSFVCGAFPLLVGCLSFIG